MNKFKIQLTKFDIGMLIAFVVVGLLGGGAWGYLSGQLQVAQDEDKSVASDYNAFAVKSGIIVSPANTKALQANDDLLKTQLDPVISSYLLAKDNGLGAVRGEDPVAWKHDLDDDVKTLTTDAKAQGVTLKPKFYFGFSRYLTESPGDAVTAVLTKQRTAVKAIMEILINSPVKAINAVQRTYEEDPHKVNENAPANDRGAEGDQLGGFAVVVPDTYTAYPFQVEFDSTPEALRPIIDGLLKSPYLFVVRTIEVHNDKLASPMLDDLPKMAGGNGAPSSVVSSAPGEVAASTPTIGPQYLFGYSILHVKMRLDMIEWNPGPKKKP